MKLLIWKIIFKNIFIISSELRKFLNEKILYFILISIKMEEIKPLQAFTQNRKIPIKTKIEAIEFAKTKNNALKLKNLELQLNQ